ncbi:uncharacterized protein [Euphorbia lathyris]|uniref:uncharacterized protein isoform X2 n=1 Tax=Euphorbia lathyris TaxID=212925 RepID=UPI003313ED3F
MVYDIIYVKFCFIEGWRQILRGKQVHGAANINETRNAAAQTPSSIAPINDLRNKRITSASPHTRATIDDEGVHSSLHRSTLDKKRHNLNNNADSELVTEMGAPHLQGSDNPQSDNPIDNYESNYPCPSDTEISPENSETFRGRSVGGRGPYKGMDLDKLTNGRKNKLVVFIPPGRYFRPIGKHSNKLSSWLGYCSRIYGPRLSLGMKLKRSTGLSFYMKTAYRRWKHKLHSQYRKYTNDDQRLKHVPKELLKFLEAKIFMNGVILIQLIVLLK